ncbi:MAG TPA: type VI secretion system accessory protein TagJ [Acetobacteraceae bacterium]|nr:type VI secretion system accessory protein TagJ [Acetobacteraceae bacterium]
MTDQTAAALFRAGKVDDAVAAAQTALRKAPTDLGVRVLLAELLVFAGNLERADVILDAASTIDPSTAMVVAEFRQLIRADMARRQLFRDGRVPEFLADPTEVQRLQLEALVALRADDVQEAAKKAAEAEAARPRVAGRHNGTAFDDLRDVDDLLAGSFEVLTTTGKYFWIPAERVTSIEFHAPKRMRDLMWRRASMSVAEGPDGDVYLPAIYVSQVAQSDPLRLGRETDWRQADGGPVCGVGQRVFLVGDDDLGVMELGTLEFGA